MSSQSGPSTSGGDGNSKEAQDMQQASTSEQSNPKASTSTAPQVTFNPIDHYLCPLTSDCKPWPSFNYFRQHVGLKPYLCAYPGGCLYKAATEGDMVKHMKSVHGQPAESDEETEMEESFSVMQLYCLYDEEAVEKEKKAREGVLSLLAQYEEDAEKKLAKGTGKGKKRSESIKRRFVELGVDSSDEMMSDSSTEEESEEDSSIVLKEKKTRGRPMKRSKKN